MMMMMTDKYGLLGTRDKVRKSGHKIDVDPRDAI